MLIPLGVTISYDEKLESVAHPFILFDKSQCKLAHFLRWHVSYYTFYVVPASPAGSCCSIFLCDFLDG